MEENAGVVIRMQQNKDSYESQILQVKTQLIQDFNLKIETEVQNVLEAERVKNRQEMAGV